MSATQNDIEAIRQLKARYFRLLDTKDWDAWRNVFTDDLEVRTDSTPATPDKPAISQVMPAGADAFIAMLRVHLAEAVTVHHGHMPEITLTGPDSATGIWAMEDIVEYPGRRLHGFGHYHEDYTRVDGAWRIARLHLTRLRVDRIGDWPATGAG